MSRLFYTFIYVIIFALCNAYDNCLPTDPIDAVRYALMIQAENPTLSLPLKFEGWWSMVVEDSFDSIYIDGEEFKNNNDIIYIDGEEFKNNDNIIYNLHGIFVSPLGVLLYGRGGTTEQQVAPLCSALVDAGYRRPYLSVCNRHVVGPAPVPQDLTPDDVSAAPTMSTTTRSPAFFFIVFDDANEKGGRGGRVYDDGFPDIVAPSVNTDGIDAVKFGDDHIPDQFMGRFNMPRTTNGTHISLTNSNNTDVLHGAMYSAILLGIILLFVQIVIYYQKFSDEQSIKPVLVEPSHLPSSLDVKTGIHPQCHDSNNY